MLSGAKALLVGESRPQTTRHECIEDAQCSGESGWQGIQVLQCKNLLLGWGTERFWAKAGE